MKPHRSKESGRQYLLFVSLALALSWPAKSANAQQAVRARHQRTQSDIVLQAEGLQTLINALFPETVGWSDPSTWPRLDSRQAVDLAGVLTKDSDEDAIFGSMGPLDGRIFSFAWNTCQPGFGCLRQSHDAWGNDRIFYAGGAPDAEGQWSAMWSRQSRDTWGRFVFPGNLERVDLNAKTDVVVYQDDFHDGGTYLAALKSNDGGLPNRTAGLVFVPLGLDLRSLEPVHERDIARSTPPCLMDRPAFADATASNCEPLESMADYVGIPWTDPVAPSDVSSQFVKRIEILGRAREPYLSDWRFVRLGFLHTDSRDVTNSPTPHHTSRGSATTKGKLQTETHLDYAAGWMNLRRDPSSRPDWSFSGRP